MSASVLALWLLAATPCKADLHLGVIATGANPSHVVNAQQEVERVLSAVEDVCVTGGEAVSAALPPAEDVAYRRGYEHISTRANKLFDEAKDAYYRNNLAQALDRFGALRALYGRAGYVPAAEIVRLSLWRTAVYLAMEDASQARKEVHQALTLEPDLKVDLTVFRPSVGELVDDVRASGMRTHTITLTGLPEGTTIQLDDRAVESRFEVAAGRHWIVVRAPHRRAFSRSLTVGRDKTLTVPMPFAVDEATETLLRQALGGEATLVPESLASKLATALQLDALLVVAPTGSGMRGVLLSAGPDRSVFPVGTPGVAQGAAFVAWAQTQLTEARRALNPEAAVADLPAFSLTVVAASAVQFRTRTSTSGDGREFTLPFVGTGPELAVDGRWRFLVWSVDGSYVTYDITEIETTLPDGTPATARGGTGVVARARVGYRLHILRRLGTDSPWAEALVTGTYEMHRARDVQAVGGGGTGLITSFKRTGAGLELHGGLPIRLGSKRLTVLGNAGVHPFQRFVEVPAASGTLRDTDPEITGGVGATFGGARWSIRLMGEASLTAVQFRGDASSAFDPELRDVQIAQNLYTATLGAAFTF